jgi:glycosyltransferase involved in cell wall biosynthesis
MKVLYLSVMDQSGWGYVSTNNILALDSTGVDLVVRAIPFGGIPQRFTPRMQELQARDISNVDVCIQHILPNSMVYNGSYGKNIAYYEAETSNYYDSMWTKYINLMDESWVPSLVNKNNAEWSGVTNSVKVVNHCIEWDRYQTLQPTAHVEELDGSYNFCFVGELSKRKNIAAILRAFHTEFHPSENVNLFLKLNSPGLNSDQCMQKFEGYHQVIKDGLKLRARYKEPIVVTGHESYGNVLSMMKQCHCFVSASYGESWCQPALDSLALGLNVIYTKGTGTEEFCGPGTIAVKSHLSPCFGAVDTLPNLYSANDLWRDIDIIDLMYSMRNMYEQRNNQDRKKIAESVKYLDYKEVGKKMLETING